MSQRLSEFFAMEAGDYLTQLDRLLAAPGATDPKELLRLARAVRGSAQMAEAETIAGVAERLEDAARSVASNTIVWSDEVRRLALQTVRDLQVLVRALNRWGPDEERRVRDALVRWDELESAESGGPGEADVVPISTLLYADEDAADGQEPVPIETLQLTGADALKEALALRPRLQAALGRAGVTAAESEILDELFDLIRLGLADTNPRG